MNKYIYYIFLLVISLFLFLLERTLMFTEDIDGGSTLSITYIIVVMILITFLTLLFSKKKIIKDQLSKRFTLLMIFVYIISLSFSIIYPFGSRYSYGSIILPLLIFYFSSYSFQYLKNNNVIIWLMTIVAILLSYYFIDNYYNNILYNTDNQSNASYAILYLIPFILCHSNIKIRIVSIIIVFFVLLISLKRGGLIAFSCGLLTYLYIDQICIKNMKFKFIGVFIVLVGAFALILFIKYINDNVLSGMLFERLEDTKDTGGSGRLDIYKYFINIIKDSSILHLIVGRGFLGSMHAGEISITCHNDILEVLVDFGIIGLVLYILFFISLIKLCKRMIRNTHNYAPAMGASIAIFLINSMVSHIWIYFWYLTEFSLFWGFIVSTTQQQQQQQQQQQ